MSCYYVGLDVHKATISVAVINAAGKPVMESVVETSAATILDFFKGLRGQVEVTFEERTYAAWLYDVLKKSKAQVIVCDPRKNRLLCDGNKSDEVDARKLARLLRARLLSPVYHGQHGTRDLKELVRRVQARVRRLFSELNHLADLRREARQALVVECRRHPASKLLLRVPTLGIVRIAQLIANVVTPHRFRGKRQFWSYCGSVVVTKSSADYRAAGAQVHRTRKAATRGLTQSHNRTLKYIFKSAALTASRCEPFKS